MHLHSVLFSSDWQLLAAVFLSILILLLFAFNRISHAVRRPMDFLQSQQQQVERADGPELPRISEADARRDKAFAAQMNRFMDVLENRFSDSIKNQEYLERFFHLSPVPMLISDISGRLEKINAVACSFFESELETLQKSNLEKLLGSRNFHVLT